MNIKSITPSPDTTKVAKQFFPGTSQITAEAMEKGREAIERLKNMKSNVTSTYTSPFNPTGHLVDKMNQLNQKAAADAYKPSLPAPRFQNAEVEKPAFLENHFFG